MLLDGRQFRSDQTCGDVVLSVDPACPETADPARTMLGNEQERWIGEQLAATTATWPVIAQQTVLSNVTLPNGAVLNYDQWDGYPAARQRLLLQAAQAARTIVLTGDIHLAAVGTMPGVGVEFVTSSISSPGLVPPDVLEVVTGFPDIVDAEFAHRGYTRHTVTPETWTAEYRIVDDVAEPAVDGVDVEDVHRRRQHARRRRLRSARSIERDLLPRHLRWRTTMAPVRSTS